MPFDVEPATTMRPPGVIATASRPGTAVRNRSTPCPAFANPGSSVPFGPVSLDDEPIRCARRARSPTTTMPSVVLDGQVEPVVVGAEIGHDLAALAERGSSRPPG